MARKKTEDDVLEIGLTDAAETAHDELIEDIVEAATTEGAGTKGDAASASYEEDGFDFEGDDDESSSVSSDEGSSSDEGGETEGTATPSSVTLGDAGDGASVTASESEMDFSPAAVSAAAPASVATPVRGAHGTKADDVIEPFAEAEVIRTFKGADVIAAGAGDDLVASGHGDDVLDGGSGDDVLNGGKGDDTLVYTLSENAGGSDHYDGGKGFDALELRLSVDEYNELREELIELQEWISEHSDVKASSGVKFKDASSKGAEKHDVFETSFGLEVRYVEDLKVVVDGHGEVSLDTTFLDETSVEEPMPEPESIPEPEPIPAPAPELSPELVTVDVAEAVAGDTPVSLTLAAGSTSTVSINVDVTERPDIYDVFMVQDLSGSFWDDLPNVKTLLPSLMESLSATGDVAFGVGSFVDKPYETFGFAPTGDYVYKTDQAISTDFDAVQASMDALRTYSGYDYPESQLEALVQTAIRASDIGFRDGSQKYVVLSTDAAFHKEGDFDTTTDAEGNIIEVADNDYDADFELEDYPAMAKVGELLEAAGITPIFAVTTYVMPLYQALVDNWGFGSVVEMASDSSNIIEAITAGITDTTVDLTLDVTGDDYGYVTGMTPEVYPDAGPGSYTFDITLEIPEDTSGMGSDGLSVSIPGYGTIDLDIEIAGMDMTGDDAANTLVGDEGNNIIDGLAGDDTLTGGAGNDTFVFADGSGTDTVTDFREGDQLDLRRVTSVATAADVIAAASQVGSDTVIDFGAGDGMVLENVDATTLGAEDFIL